MGKILYSIATILLIVWAIAFIGCALGGITHCLLIVACVAISIQLLVLKSKDNI